MTHQPSWLESTGVCGVRQSHAGGSSVKKTRQLRLISLCAEFVMLTRRSSERLRRKRLQEHGITHPHLSFSNLFCYLYASSAAELTDHRVLKPAKLSLPATLLSYMYGLNSHTRSRVGSKTPCTNKLAPCTVDVCMHGNKGKASLCFSNDSAGTA